MLRRGQKIGRFLMAGPVLAGLLACAGGDDGPVVARVGDERLTLRELEAQIPVQVAGRLTPEKKRQLVEGWVEEELLYQEALERDLEKDPAVARRLARATRDLLIAALLELETRREDTIPEAEIRSFYEAHQEAFQREQTEVRARHILLENRSDMNRVWERLRAGELFDQVAREESIDSSAEDGGDLGYYTETQVDPSFWEVCQQTPVGRLARENTRLGYHIVEVLDRREAGTVRDFLEVKGEIRQRLQAERRQALRASLLERARGRVPWSISPEVLGVDEGE